MQAHEQPLDRPGDEPTRFIAATNAPGAGSDAHAAVMRPLNAAGSMRLRRRMLRQRRGSAYVLVLGIAVMVFMISAAGIAVSRVQARVADRESDTTEARRYANAAIELVQWYIARDPNWRTSRSNGLWVSDQPIGQGAFSVEVVNPNGSLDESKLGSVIVTGIGHKGNARQMVQVTLSAHVEPLTCLSVAACAGSNIILAGGSVGPAGTVIAANENITSSKTIVQAEAQAGKAIAGGTYSGPTASGAYSRALPDNSVFEYYLERGTPISAAAMSAAGWKIERTLLSPASNPFGSATNPEGIYIIDCRGNRITISRCRIVGTLVLLQPGSGSRIEHSVHIAPAVAHYPSLVVRGDITFKLSDANLRENDAKVNLNPLGSPYPYPAGDSDADTNDTYPNRIMGLVYVSGNLKNESPISVDRLIVGGTLRSEDTLLFNTGFDPGETIPPGFEHIEMRPVSGTWRQVVE